MVGNKFGFINKLKGVVPIKTLFEQPLMDKVFPVKAFYQLSEEGVVVPKIGVSVSKKLFKKAVDRNRIKRLMREAVRLNLKDLTTANHQVEKIMLIYLSNRLPLQNELSLKVNELFNLLVKKNPQKL